MKVYLYDMFHRCDSLTDWTPTECTLALDSTQKVEGKYSIKMTSNNNEISYMAYNRTVDWSEFGTITFSVYHPGWTNEVGGIILWTDGANWSKWLFDYSASWKEIKIDLSSPPDLSNGTLDLSNITSIMVRHEDFEDPGEDYYFDFFRGRTIDVTDSITYLKITEEMGMPSVAELKIKGESLDQFQAGLELEVYDKDDVLSWKGRILYPESVLEGTQVVGKLKALGINSQFSNAYRKNYTTARSSDYILKDIIDNGLNRFYYDDEIDDFSALTYKYDMKTSIQKMFKYVAMLERGVIHYLPDGEISFREYDNLSKGPQIYQGTYNFEDDAVGTSPSGWVDADGANCSSTIIASLGGHKKVLQQYDNNAASWAAINNSFSPQITGTVELYFRTTDNTVTNNLWLRNNGTNVIVIDLNSIAGVGDDTWYRYKIVFDCTPDTYDHYLNGVLIAAGLAFTNVVDSITSIHLVTDFGNAGFYNYFAAIGIVGVNGYTVGDNLKGWDESTSKIKILSYTPSANRHITRTPVSGTVNSEGQVYYVGKAIDAAVQKYGINQLQPWRDPEISNYTEAKQLGDNLLAMYSMDTQMITMLAVGKGHLQVGKTLNVGWAGVFTIAQGDLLLTKRIWYPTNDINELELTDNVLTKKAFNIRVINKFYDEDAQEHLDIADLPESTADGTVIEGARHDRFVWRVPEPTGYDFDKATLATIGDVDANWFDLDLSAIIPVGTTSVKVRVNALDNATGSQFWLRKKGQTSSYQIGSIFTCMANMAEHDQLDIGVDSDRKIQFLASPKASDWTSIYLLVIGWDI